METSSPESPRPGLRQYVPDVLLLLLLLALTLKFTYRIADVRDIITDDEARYLAHGHYLKQWGLPEACYGPLYVLWYHAWDQFHLDPVFVYHSNWKLLIFLLAAGMYILVRTLGGYRVVALVFGFLTLTSGVVDVWPYPMHLVTFVLAMGAATAARLRSWPWSLAAIGIALAVAAFLRPEYTLSLLLFAPVGIGCALWFAFKRHDLRLRLVLAVCLVTALVGGLFATFGNPLAGSRSYLAFGQHYSLNRWIARLTPADPWTNWETITRADFGEAKTIPQALKNNPRAIGWHFWRNLAQVPGHVREMTASQLELNFKLEIVLRVLVAVCALAGMAGFLRRLFRPAPGDDPADRSLRIVLGMLLFALAPTMFSLVVIFPRMHYLLPLVCFGGALICAGYRGFPRLFARLRWLEAWPALVAVALLLALGTPNKVHRWSVQQRLRSAWVKPTPTLEVQRTIAVMRTLQVRSAAPVVVLESDYSRAFFAGWDFETVDHWGKTLGFWQFVATRNIAVVVLNERLLNDTRFRDDPEFQEFASEKQPGRFRFFAVPNTPVRVAVRQDALPDVSPYFFVALNFLDSREYDTALIVRDYQRFLSRTPAVSEIAYWLKIREHGSQALVLAGILTSPEYYGRGGNTDKNWVNNLHHDLLGRPADATEENHWLQKLANGVSKSDVVLGIATSAEGEGNRVRGYYQQYLGRNASSEEIAHGVEDLRHGATDKMVLADILSGPEFRGRAGDSDKAWVGALYGNLLRRVPAGGEDQSWVRMLPVAGD